MFCEGSIVISKQGRDKGLAFIIVAVENEFCYLVDGRLRLLEKPKKKKQKHLQPTKYVSQYIKERLANNSKQTLLDSDFRRELKAFFNEGKAEGGLCLV